MKMKKDLFCFDGERTKEKKESRMQKQCILFYFVSHGNL